MSAGRPLPRRPTGRLPRLARAAAACALLLGPAAASPASISVEGGAIILGRTQSSPVVIRVDEPAGKDLYPLRLSVNVGRFSEPVRLGPGKYRATYVPPDTRFPQVALVAVWRETGADAQIDFLRIPLFGKTRLKVSARPKAEASARVGIDTFGPAVADRAGHAEIPIHVEPGVQECDVTVREAVGQEATKRVKVEVPPYNRLTAALVPHAVVADGQSTVRLDVFYDLGGAHVPPDRIHVTPSAGVVTYERGARGLYTYRYVPPAETPATTVAFEVTVDGDPTARAAARLALGLPPPARVVVNGPPRRLRVGSGASGPVSVLVLDAAGMGLPGVAVTADAAGQPLGAPVYRGGGLYEFTLAAPAVYPPAGIVPVRARAVAARATVDGTLNLQLDAPPVPASVSSRFEPSPVPADGVTAARLVLEVRDASGQPLEHAQLVSAVSHGVLGAPRERGNGVYEHSYVPPGELPDQDVQLRVTDGTGSFERRFPVPLRRHARRLSVGLGAGYTRASGDASGARVVGEVWLPFAGRFGAGLSAGYGTAAKTVHDAAGALSSRTTATFVPLALELGWDAYQGRRLTLTLGGGVVGAWAEFRTSLSGAVARGLGAGWKGFADAAWWIGPGQAVLGLSYAVVPVETAAYRIDPGGVSATLVYRVALL